jgi:DNA-binding transcriptional ArsR family regulator
MKETFKIKDLEQIKLLSDPLKLQLLQAFAEKPLTTKQVASDLGESVTKLYRHVDALHDAGLLEIAGEQQKRGTVERTFRAVARRFEADHSLFADQGDAEGPNAARDMLRACESEILAALTMQGTRSDNDPIVMRLRCKASPARIAELRDSLSAWIAATQQDDEAGDAGKEGTEEVGALIAFYPIT